MQWFEKGYDRDTVADQIIKVGEKVGQVEVVCDGLRRNKFVAEKLRTICYLSHYTERKVYDVDEGAWVALPNSSFSLLQIEYDAPDGTRVNARVHVDNQHTTVERSSEYIRRGVDQIEDDEEAAKVRGEIWDETVAVLDEALYGHAQRIQVEARGQATRAEDEDLYKQARELGTLLAGMNLIPRETVPESTAAPALLDAA